MNPQPAGNGRLTVALGLLAVLAAGAFTTLESGRFRNVTLLVLAFFAFQVYLGWLRSRRG